MRCPFAVWKPLPENATQGSIDPDQVILHSAVDAPGPTSLYPFFARSDVGVESTFFVKLDGVIEQYMDTTVRADANLDSNWRAVSIETEDEGNPDQRPWSPAQMASIKRLLTWLFQTHPKILRRVCPAWNSPGVGYHSMWGAPSHWTPARGKTCPGTIRIEQFKNDIVPWLQGAEEDMPLTATEIASVAKAVWAYQIEQPHVAGSMSPASSYLKYANYNAAIAAGKPTAEQIADAVVAALPSGAVDAAVVKAAVKEALREGTGS